MTLDADQIVDRRRMRRRLTIWRTVAVIAIIFAAAGIAILAAPESARIAARSSTAIARVTIEGLIRTNQKRVEALDELARSRAPAVIVYINSPGGTTAGAEQLYEALMRLKASKPLVVVIGGLAASGGYIAALPADYIVASQTSLVGSIGVLFQYPNVSDLLKTVGVKVEAIRSTPLKAMPSGYEPTSPEARAAIEAIVKDSYAWFRELVRERRHLDAEMTERVADGRIFTGRQGLDLKLIDALGNEMTAREWLAKERNIDIKTPVRDYPLTTRLTDLPVPFVALARLLDALGLSSLAQRLNDWGAVRALDRLNLDGLLALWHPPTSD